MDASLRSTRHTQYLLVALQHPSRGPTLVSRSFGLRSMLYMHPLPEDLGFDCPRDMHQEIRT